MPWESTNTDIDIHNVFFLVYVNVSVSRLSIPDCPISNVFFLCMSISVSLDCPFLIATSLTSFSCACQCQCLWHWHTQEKDVRDRTIRNGQSRHTDIDMHKKKTLEKDNQELSIPNYHISNVYWHLFLLKQYLHVGINMACHIFYICFILYKHINNINNIRR
jgi:hypothetical protein